MVFKAVLSQMIFLFALIGIGYFLAKLRLVPKGTEGILSKLENYLFIPALALGTFITNFTVEKLSSAGRLLLISIAIEVVVVCVSLFLVRLCAKDKYTRNIFLYGLCFSNFAFMGNAVVSAVFPEIFLEYLIFSIVLWALIYAWGIPVLLMGDTGEKPTFKNRLKSFINPMFICMLIGMIIGLFAIPMPKFVLDLTTSLGNCMSPIAMLLTGMTVARSRFVELLKIKSVYVITTLRLIIYPLIFILIALVIPMSRTAIICGFCSLSMSLGLNTIVVPNAYGKDTKVASSMALISLLCCITVPLMYLLLDFLLL